LIFRWAYHILFFFFAGKTSYALPTLALDFQAVPPFFFFFPATVTPLGDSSKARLNNLFPNGLPLLVHSSAAHVSFAAQVFFENSQCSPKDLLASPPTILFSGDRNPSSPSISSIAETFNVLGTSFMDFSFSGFGTMGT